MQHYKSLDSVLANVETFLQINADTMAVAERAWRCLEPEMEGILRQFHSRAAEVPGLQSRSEQELRKLMKLQKEKTCLLLTDRLGEQYVQTAMRFALSFRERQLPLGWYIASSMAIAEIMGQRLKSHPNLSESDVLNLNNAVLKLVAVDISIASTAYTAALLD